MMKNKLKWVAAFSLLLPMTFVQSAAAGSYTADLQRLHWVCRDYQLPIQGYVVEGWLQVVHVPGMEKFLQEQLQIETGIHQVALTDGSMLNTGMTRQNGKWHIEMQLITKSVQQAELYYNRWQQFADRYCPNHPVGVTIVSQLPEQLSEQSQQQLLSELAHSMELEPVSQIQTEQYTQLTGHSKQLLHGITVNGTTVNGSITIAPQEENTWLYVASPILYQQF